MFGFGFAIWMSAVLGGAGNAASYATDPAPAGFHWEFVTDGGVRVTDSGQPVVDLVGN